MVTIWLIVRRRYEQSLERMCLELARDKLNYSSEQMDALTERIRVGDLTTVMQIYEENIKSPLKSAVAGTLLRTLFVQVQKAKVCCHRLVACSSFLGTLRAHILTR